MVAFWERKAPVYLSRLFFAASLLTIAHAVFRGTRWVHWLVQAFSLVVFPIDIGGLGLAAFLTIVGAGLLRRKRAAWWLALVFLCLQWIVPVVVSVLVAREWWQGHSLDEPLERAMLSYLFNSLSVALLIVGLVVARRSFAARLTPGNMRYALATLAVGLTTSVATGLLLGWLTGHEGGPRNRLLSILDHLVFGSAASRPRMVPEWVQLFVGSLFALTMLGALLVLLRSQRQRANLPLDDELHVRALLDENPDDSLGYFNTRRDKQTRFSATGQAGVAYRVQGGVCLASGDPLGRREHWPAALASWLEMVRHYGWTPAVVGASEDGAVAWDRAGLRVIRVGDEAILRPDRFDLAGRELKAVRQTVERLTRAGYRTRVRRHRDIGAAELQRLIGLADRWRDGDDRGFSMALNRLGDPLDGNCLLVEALFPDDHLGDREDARVAGLLSFVPWGRDGLSLDVMRRNPEADNGVTELMVTGLMAAGRELGIRRVSLNFAVFRSTIEEGERVGASRVRRLQRRTLMLFSRWFQIEQLYRSNVKYAPQWSPRFLAYEEAADLGPVGAAMGVAEGFLDVPRWLDPLPVPQQQLVAADDPRVVAFLTRPETEVAPRRLPEQVRRRFDERAEIIASGGQAYPVHTGVDAHCADVAGAPGRAMTIGGRVMAVSDHGGVVFARVQDWSGQAQVLLDQTSLGREELRRFSHAVDLGDHFSFTGTTGASRNGTPSLLTQAWQLTSKCLRPLPDKHRGLADPELLVRNRHLDLVMSHASRDRLAARSRTIQSVRQTLLGQDFLEVETPILQTIHGGANARPFRTHINAYDLDLYLRIAPELYLKRLMVGGLDRIFEIGRNFRNEGADATHNPEFTVLEAYQANGDYQSMRVLTEQLVRDAAVAATGGTIVRGRDAHGVEHEVDLAEPWRWVSVHEAVSQASGVELTPDTPREQLADLVRQLGGEVDPRWTRGAVLDELYDHFCEKQTMAPTFYCDFPAESSPLTRPHRDDPRLAERWDLVMFGSELGTAYSELVDPVVQRERLTQQSLQAAGGDPEAMELDEDFLTALEYGMAPTGGLGIGLDRLAMLMTGASIRKSIAFPLVRPRS